jgi:Fe-S-cluster containining protein
MFDGRLNIPGTMSNDSSYYHSLQITANKRMSNHVNFTSSYVFSKTLCTAEVQAAPPVLRRTSATWRRNVADVTPTSGTCRNSRRRAEAWLKPGASTLGQSHLLLVAGVVGASRTQLLASRTCVRYDFRMGNPRSVRRRDHELVQIVDAALADSLNRSGSWVVCRPGCTQCCIGVFPINQLDAARLREGLAELEKQDPQRANRVRRRARAAVRRLQANFPGDAATGTLAEDSAQFEEFANDEPCPALDPKTGRCDLYAARPMTCRVFGPPVRSEGGLGVCELCFQGATEEQIAACELRTDTDELEAQLLRRVERATGKRGDTIVAFALGL